MICPNCQTIVECPTCEPERKMPEGCVCDLEGDDESPVCHQFIARETVGVWCRKCEHEAGCHKGAK